MAVFKRQVTQNVSHLSDTINGQCTLSKKTGLSWEEMKELEDAWER